MEKPLIVLVIILFVNINGEDFAVNMNVDKMKGWLCMLVKKENPEEGICNKPCLGAPSMIFIGFTAGSDWLGHTGS